MHNKTSKQGLVFITTKVRTFAMKELVLELGCLFREHLLCAWHPA